MTDSRIWLSSPHMGGEELNYIHAAFDTNWIAPLGPHVDGFEHDLESFLGEDMHAAALSSGTASLHLALIILGVQPGDEVICQSMTFAASANPIVYLGANPIFIDSETSTWNICPDALETAIIDRIKKGKKPKAIVIVHLYGMPALMHEIMEISYRYGIPVIEDAAEALGSKYKGRYLGTFGDIGILSFNGNKIITTSGGGALISANEMFVQKAKFLSTQALDPAPHYQHSHIGYNYKMSNICAAIGRGQMKVLNNRIEQRRNNFLYYAEELRSVDGLQFQFEPTTDFFSNHWLSAFIMQQGKLFKDDIRNALIASNIDCRPLWKPMHLQPIYHKYAYYGNKVSNDLFYAGLCLPSGSNLSVQELEKIVSIIKNIPVLHEPKPDYAESIP